MNDAILSPELIHDFQVQGYVKIEGLISSEQVTELARDYDKAISGEIPVPAFGDDHVQGRMVQLANPSRHIPDWQLHAYFQRALAIARQLIGDNAEYAYDQIIYKPPHHPAETPWHQDAGYWKESRGSDNAVTCWLALSPAWRENGGMQFVPQSHKGEIQEHIKVADRAEINSALETNVDPESAVAVALNPGDATFHHCRTLHYTSGNFTDTPRKALITHFWSR